MTNNNANIDHIISQVLSGDFSSDDLECLMDWCGESEKNMEYFRQVKKLWNLSAGARLTAEDVETSLAALKSRAYGMRRRRTLLGTAAAAVIAAIAIIFSVTLTNDTPNASVVAEHFPAYSQEKGISLTLEDGTTLDVGSASAVLIPVEGVTINGESVVYSTEYSTPVEIKMNTLKVGRGEKYTVTLSDGTKVWLNSGSTLTYPVKFGQDAREVVMTGECYFDVVRNEERPFIVRTADLAAEVLGTTFNMTAYENEGGASITLASGKVRAVAAGATLLMEPGMRVELNAESGELSSSTVNPVDYAGWIDGRYMFRNATFGQMLAKLELWYNVRITDESGLDSQMLFNGDFDNMDIESAVKSLTINTSTVYEYDRENNSFTIKKR